ncbi:hypothetical protein BKA64DRAFT_766424 [Cadophora sp. MPI-SDFR-AT-0126]|nr:hypothetical protein BKA64DRAFT_766424 [Leotiomycetes sp. MPI-SDFR-AT-0126]
MSCSLPTPMRRPLISRALVLLDIGQTSIAAGFILLNSDLAAFPSTSALTAVEEWPGAQHLEDQKLPAKIFCNTSTGEAVAYGYPPSEIAFDAVKEFFKQRFFDIVSSEPSEWNQDNIDYRDYKALLGYHLDHTFRKIEEKLGNQQLLYGQQFEALIYFTTPASWDKKLALALCRTIMDAAKQMTIERHWKVSAEAVHSEGVCSFFSPEIAEAVEDDEDDVKWITVQELLTVVDLGGSTADVCALPYSRNTVQGGIGVKMTDFSIQLPTQPIYERLRKALDARMTPYISDANLRYRELNIITKSAGWNDVCHVLDKIMNKDFRFEFRVTHPLLQDRIYLLENEVQEAFNPYLEVLEREIPRLKIGDNAGNLFTLKHLVVTGKTHDL